MLVVVKAAAESRLQGLVQGLLARMPERWMAEIVAVADRLGQVLVQSKRPCHRSRDAASLDRVRQPGPVVVALGGDEDLRLVLEPSEALAMDDPVSVTLKRSAQPAGLLLALAPRRIRGRRRRREVLGLECADP